MSEQEKKAIDACKDQAAQEFFPNAHSAEHALKIGLYDVHQAKTKGLIDRAMQLYGEMCRKEGPIPDAPVQGPIMECHRCGEPCAGTYKDVPTCFTCARGLADD